MTAAANLFHPASPPAHITARMHARRMLAYVTSALLLTVDLFLP